MLKEASFIPRRLPPQFESIVNNNVRAKTSISHHGSLYLARSTYLELKNISTKISGTPVASAAASSLVHTCVSELATSPRASIAAARRPSVSHHAISWAIAK